MKRSVFVLFTVLSIIGVPLIVNAQIPGVSVSAGFQHPDARIFPVGQMLSNQDILNDPNLDPTLGDFFPIFYLQISGSSSSPDTLQNHFILTGNGLPLIDVTSTPYPFANWMNAIPGHNGRYTNVEYHEFIESTDWYSNESSTYSKDDLLGLVDGGNLQSGIYTLTLTVTKVNAPVATSTFIATTQVSNPGSPQL
jgi:hypothetical protein